MTTLLPRGALAMASLCAGFSVGLLDGARAGFAVDPDWVGVVCAALLAASVDAVVAVVVAGGVAVLLATARWGRQTRARAATELLAAGAMGVVSGLAALAAFSATEPRRNRFLAAGIVALLVVTVGVLSALLTPALARLLSRRRGEPPVKAVAAPLREPRVPASAWWPEWLQWVAPAAALGLAACACGAVVFSLSLKVRTSDRAVPSSGWWSWSSFSSSSPWISSRWLVMTVVVAASLPVILVALGRLPIGESLRSRRRRDHRREPAREPGKSGPSLMSAPYKRRAIWPAAAPAVAVGIVVFTVAAAVSFARRHWDANLRFLPWTHILVAAAILAGTAVALAFASAFAHKLAPVRASAPNLAPRGLLAHRLSKLPLLRLVVASAAAAVCVVALITSEFEPARKAIFARAGLAGPALLAARAVLDRDRDGHSPWFGGGDCDDGDNTIHPGMLDDPDDGIDQNCDGRDVHVATLTPPEFVPVPDSVPRDLNLLLITIDTVRADHFGAYGYARPTSPEIDRLAAEGSLFVNGWAHAPSTRYSMPAIATGRWPSAIEWDESIWWPRIGQRVRTIGEALKAAGYFTAAFYSFEYFALAERRGFERGIDLYRADRAALHQSVNGPMESHGSSSEQVADDAIALFETHPDGKVFLWAHFYDPHLSYEPHAEVPGFGSERIDLYDGEIRFTDMHIGRLFRRLRELGLWDRTAVVVTGDHGEGFGEHGIREHGFDLYPAQTKVPFIIRVPGLPVGRRIERPAGHVDLAPTLLNLARAPQEPSFLGRSLLPDLAGVAERRGAAPGDSGYGEAQAVFQEVSSERGKKRALVTRDMQVIWNWTPDNTTECYDRRTDPEQLHDLWGRRRYAEPCGRLKATLQDMVSALSVPSDLASRRKDSVFPRGSAPPPVPPRVAIDARVGDGIRVLGHSSSALTVRAGQTVNVEVHFECLRPVPPGWRAFFHLVGDGGFFRNLDHVPVAGAMPLERWKPGQRIVDRFPISLPTGTPPGRYRLIFGLFLGAGRQPVVPAAVSDGKNAVRVLEIELR